MQPCDCHVVGQKSEQHCAVRNETRMATNPQTIPKIWKNVREGLGQPFHKAGKRLQRQYGRNYVQYSEQRLALPV
jgi:hypothetical protein